MSHRWVPTPHHLPRKCIVNGSSGESDGPFYEFVFPRLDLTPTPDGPPIGTGAELHMAYISRRAIASMLVDENSPDILCNRVEFDQIVQEHHDLTEKVAELEAQTDELRSRLALASAPLDTALVATAVADEIESRRTAAAAERMATARVARGRK